MVTIYNLKSNFQVILLFEADSPLNCTSSLFYYHHLNIKDVNLLFLKLYFIFVLLSPLKHKGRQSSFS